MHLPAPQLHFTHTIRSLTFLPFGSRQIRTGNPQKFSYFPTYHTTGFHTLLPYLPSNPIICPHRLSPSHPHLSVPTTLTLFHTLSPPFHTNYFFLPPFHPIFALYRFFLDSTPKCNSESPTDLAVDGLKVVPFFLRGGQAQHKIKRGTGVPRGSINFVLSCITN